MTNAPLPNRALVADPDPMRHAETVAALAAAGFQVRSAHDAESLAAALESEPSDVLLVDNVLRGFLPRNDAPVLLLLDPQDELDIAALEGWTVADFTYRGQPPAFRAHRALVLIARAAERTRRRSEAESLRESLRKVSAAIRSTIDPNRIARHLVDGIGEALGAEHVWFTTFPDARVPQVSAEWNAPGLAPGVLPAELTDDVTMFELAERLWAEAEVQPLPRRAAEDGPGGAGAHGGAGAPSASVVVPVGEGDLVLGVIWIARPDTAQEWTRAEIGLIQHVSGNLAYGLMQSHLIGAQQQVMVKLQELDQAKTDFLTTVNHELRTPLTSITAYLDMIRSGAGGPLPAGVGRMVDVISRNAERLRRLIEDMLTVSHQDTSGDLQLSRVNLGALLRLVVSTLQPLADSRSLSLTVTHAPGTVTVQADEAKLEQVFANIISNAIKFTPAGGHVAVSSEISSDHGAVPSVVVRVEDTGVGIPETEIDQVFTRFFRASNASTAAIPGSGLGLAIAHDIVERHSGRLDVESALGVGTTVSVRLPLDPES
ncbi:ATP-binding response regulator [Arthrobacter bambusae]|uniref:ATP-binding response regulator n=1 Tax=Arthrobacter bambusae TaxID=1338426 RepID=UPI0027831CE3|nr:ATP-binding protein [Arthrobacter bambusae]MDQ0032171.1 signal transduction histidine kinase [Arthrobacter bambusae]MDQ0100293.1 signal transduction histidine kinase [Arthrobacter bambusae]